MIFSSQEFVFSFLPVFLAVYYIAPAKVRNLVLFLGSLWFYFTGEQTWFFLIIFSLILHFILTSLMAGRPRWTRQRLLAILLSYDFGTLFFFKYMPFLLQELSRLLEGLGMGAGVLSPPKNLTLPLGISFYTFQIAAYAIDVYRQPRSRSSSFVNLGAYLSMFPQLIAGPIVLYDSVALQLKKRRIGPESLEKGLKLFVAGLGYKMLIADVLGNLWHEIQVAGIESISTAMAWLGALAFTFQLYFDFNGYSLMAMGLGAMLGFQIPRNFKHPYLAVSVTDFWRRWHISLSAWFRNYVYIPLGGNRRGKGRMVTNLFLVWALTGIWHGAGWNFLLWGVYYFFFLVLEKFLLGRFLEKHRGIGWCYTFLIVISGWVIFQAPDLGAAGIHLKKMFLWPGQPGAWTQNLHVTLAAVKRYGPFLAAAALCSTCLPENLYRKCQNELWIKLLLLAIFWICVYRMVTAKANPFLYFRF